jgi:hypothetical protein
MIDNAVILLTTLLMLYIARNAVRLDRSRPWFQELAPSGPADRIRKDKSRSAAPAAGKSARPPRHRAG